MTADVSPDRQAEVENALDAAEELSHLGHTRRVCLVCGNALVVEVVGASYRVICSLERRVIVTSRGL